MTDVNLPSWFVRDAADKEIDLMGGINGNKDRISELRLLKQMGETAFYFSDQVPVYMTLSKDDFAMIARSAGLILKERSEAEEKRFTIVNPNVKPD